MAKETEKDPKEDCGNAVAEEKPVIASCWQLEHAINFDIRDEPSIRELAEEVFDNGRGIPCHACDRFGKDRQSDPALACVTCNLHDKIKAEQVKGLKKKECWQKGILTTSKPYSCSIRWELPAKHEELKFAKETNVHDETSPSKRTRRSLVGTFASAGASQSMEERWPMLEKLRRELEDEAEAEESEEGETKKKAPSKAKQAKPTDSSKTSSARRMSKTGDARDKKSVGKSASEKEDPKKKKVSAKPKKRKAPPQNAGQSKERIDKKSPTEKDESRKKTTPKSKKRKTPDPKATQTEECANKRTPTGKDEAKKKAAPKSKKRKVSPKDSAATSSGLGKKEEAKQGTAKAPANGDGGNNAPAVSQDPNEPSAKRQKIDDTKKAPSAASAAARSIPPGIIPPTPLMAALMDKSMMMLAGRAPTAGVAPTAAETIAAAARVTAASSGAPIPFRAGTAPSRLFGLTQQNSTLQSQHSAMQSQVIAHLQLERSQMLKRCALLEAELRGSQAQNKALMDFNYKLEASMNMLQTQQQATQSRMQQLEKFSDSLSSVDQGVRRILEESFKTGTHKQTKIKAIWNAMESAFGETGPKDCLDFVSKNYGDLSKKREVNKEAGKREGNKEVSKKREGNKEVSKKREGVKEASKREGIKEAVKQAKQTKTMKQTKGSNDKGLAGNTEDATPKKKSPARKITNGARKIQGDSAVPAK